MTKDSPFTLANTHSGISRRNLVKAGAATLVTLFAPAPASVARAKQLLQSAPLRDPWLTINQVQLQLLPEDGNGPGAIQAGALPYLRAALEEPGQDQQTVAFIFNGVGWLNTESNNIHQAAFASLNSEQQQQILLAIARSRAGENWLSTLLSFAIEGLLADPLYGGNLDLQGWQWLQHNPGFPRPQHPWYHHL